MVVRRGNSASGKSSVAAGVREKFGRGLAIVDVAAADDATALAFQQLLADRRAHATAGGRACPTGGAGMASMEVSRSRCFRCCRSLRSWAFAQHRLSPCAPTHPPVEMVSRQRSWVVGGIRS
ncbi:DUF6207 family protein [Streptomyces sp. R11]|uniref:DUF6207 family protein n=1 Tax=Streptomyces sp. R11 TaxID=3238625 RepID=A0AB39NDB8_9ACTN